MGVIGTPQQLSDIFRNEETNNPARNLVAARYEDGVHIEVHSQPVDETGAFEMTAPVEVSSIVLNERDTLRLCHFLLTNSEKWLNGTQPDGELQFYG